MHGSRMLTFYLTSGRARHTSTAVIAFIAVFAVSCHDAATEVGSEIASIQITPSSLAMTTGSARALTAAVMRASGTPISGAQVHWTTQNPGIATVSQLGLVTAVQPGKTQIAASKSGRSAVVQVTVSALPAALVRVTPASSNILVRSTAQLAGEVLDTGGGLLHGYTIVWTSNSAAVATVNANGVVTGVSQGNVVITATAAGLSGTAVVSVRPVPVATVNVAPTTGSVQVGQTLQLTVRLLDAAGNILTGRTVSWSSANTATATVTASGLVRGIKRGTTTITTTSEGKTGTASITVP
ncbi:MAG: Ig-like domain-containing protein [Gemmatimonadaceae bacterium]